ncbi:MAG: RNA polymerase sigma factor region1.1 domain-containing protein [Candidatus Aureabacteria bacterium]|nr:RNA polymerase sigma factor region1.1 domain-containing protein [Candidatus Auribacterota bacterium]
MATIEKNQKIKALIHLANEQGHLSYANINDALPDVVVSAEEIDSVIMLLRGMDIEILDDKEAARKKAGGAAPGKSEKKVRAPKLEFIDDPVRMYRGDPDQADPLLARLYPHHRHTARRPRVHGPGTVRPRYPGQKSHKPRHLHHRRQRDLRRAP